MVRARPTPQSQFLRLLRWMRSRTSRATLGRPPLRRRDFKVQNRRKPLRCQPTTVSGFTMNGTSRRSGRIRERITHNSRSADHDDSRGEVRLSAARRYSAGDLLFSGLLPRHRAQEAPHGDQIIHPLRLKGRAWPEIDTVLGLAKLFQSA